MSEQNFKNHAQVIPLFHGVTFLGLLLTFIGGFVHLFGAWGTDHQYASTLIVVLAALGLLTAWFARVFALKAQDRAIRAEENLRNFARHGKLLDSRLSISQVIALRFAPDEEYDALASRAIAEKLTQKDIKQSIKNWKPDTYRV